jgi:hypothetical protein
VGVERAHHDPSVLSPELVLVSSPEDAKDARAQLPEPPWRIAPNARPRLHEETTLDPDGSSSKRLKLRVVSLVALALVGLGAARYLSDSSRDARPASAGALSTPSVARASRHARTPSVPIAPRQRQQTRTLAPTSPQVRSRAARTTPGRARRSASSAAARPKRVTPTKRKTSAKTQPKTVRRKKTAPPRAATFVPARTWAWAPAKGAAAYDVIFFREGRIVFRARPTQPRVVMPHSFRFQAGKYRWTVRALPLSAGAPLIIDSTFSLTSAGATKANHSSG